MMQFVRFFLENDAEIVTEGCLRERLEALKGLLGRSWGRFVRHFGVGGRCFLRFVWEKCDSEISMPLCSGIATFAGRGDQGGATWGQK